MSETIPTQDMPSLYRRGNLAIGSGFNRVTSPNLNPSNELFIDGEQLEEYVSAFSFRPNEDISAEDTGHGVVRIAWEELENSGTINFTLEDVHSSDLDYLIDLLLETKAYRWLSFRGRRYRVNGFTPTYQVQRNPNRYTINVQCTAYRPHKSIPPVPGTEIFPILDLRRYGAQDVHDTILHVGGSGNWVIVFHTSGLMAYNTQTGTTFDEHVKLSSAGLVSSHGEQLFAVAGLENGTTMFFGMHPKRGWEVRRHVLSHPFSLNSFRLSGDTIEYTTSTQTISLRWTQNSTRILNSYPSGTRRINPIGTPAFLDTRNDTTLTDVALNVPEDALGVCMSGSDRAIVFRPTGVYMHHATRHTDSIVEVGQPIMVTQDGSTTLVPQNLHPSRNIQRFGIFGSPGIPEGFWLVDESTTEMEPYMPDSAQATPRIATLEDGRNLYQHAFQAGFLPPASDELGADEMTADEVRKLIPASMLTDPFGLYINPHLSIHPIVYSGIGNTSLVEPTSGPVRSFIQSRQTSIDAYTQWDGDGTPPDNISHGARYWFEAHLPESSSITAYVSINESEWTELPQADEGIGMHGGRIYGGDIPGLEAGESTEGKNIQFRFRLDSADVRNGLPEVHFVAWAISGKFTNFPFTDVDGDGVLEAPTIYKHAGLRSAYAEGHTEWANLQGVYFDGFSYYAYTDLHVFQTFPLI